MLYPNIAPRAEPAEQINANLKALDFKPKHRAINNTSGGIGKNEASTKASINNATPPHLESDHSKTH